MISNDMICRLEIIREVSEVKDDMWFCDFLKVLGYDGYNLNFIKKCWGIIGEDFIVMVFDFFYVGMLFKELNIIWILFILKEEVVCELDKFRFISMVCCVYKVIVKVLVRRLKFIFLNLVGEI